MNEQASTGDGEGISTFHMNLAGKIKYKEHDRYVCGKQHCVKMIPLDEVTLNDEYKDE